MKIKHKDKFKSTFTTKIKVSEETRPPNIGQLLLSKTSGEAVLNTVQYCTQNIYQVYQVSPKSHNRCHTVTT
jgi:hypothetical protein